MPNIRALNFIKQTVFDLKKETDKKNKKETDDSTIIVSDFNILFLEINRLYRKINKDTLKLNYTTDQGPLTSFYKTFYSITTEQTIFRSVCEISSFFFFEAKTNSQKLKKSLKFYPIRFLIIMEWNWKSIQQRL